MPELSAEPGTQAGPSGGSSTHGTCGTSVVNLSFHQINLVLLGLRAFHTLISLLKAPIFPYLSRLTNSGSPSSGDTHSLHELPRASILPGTHARHL